MSASADPYSYEGRLRVYNGLYRIYREEGIFFGWSRASYRRAFDKYVVQEPRTLPNPHTLRFFDNWSWAPTEYRVSSPTTGPLTGRAGMREAQLRSFFANERHVFQRVLGVGGNGLAAHFKDRGPLNTDDPARDFVVKVALTSWNSDDIIHEKRMMRKVKGSAHCIQIIEPQDIGKAESEPHIPKLPDYDSSVDEESSGNDSLNERVVRGRYRILKRKTRPARHWTQKRKRREIRVQQIEEENKKRGKTRRDYIIMEYMHNGSLARLITALNDPSFAEEKGENERKLVEVPNRVLWGFWLCLVRSCVAMEYPPRKFHPMREKPLERTGNVSYLQAKAFGMIRDLKNLGIRFLDPGAQAEQEDQYTALDGDMIETIPDSDWKRQRRMNLVHRDLDPQNIFVDGFELDKPSWERLPGDVRRGEYFQRTEKRPDRLDREHELIPRLKIADFGLADCIKREKRNIYYVRNRYGCKLGEFPPEIFGPEWEKVELDADGDYLANSRICGYLSNKTNIWCIAVSMWELITKCRGPVPPTPQPPYHLRDDSNYPPNAFGQRNYDDILKDPEYAGIPISYCALLRDPRCILFNRVDEALRETIFQCMYHRPEDRPSLEKLLKQAEEKVQEDFPGETDDDIRRWIHFWFDDASSTPEHSAPSNPSSYPPTQQPISTASPLFTPSEGSPSPENPGPTPGKVSPVNQSIAAGEAHQISQILNRVAQSSADNPVAQRARDLCTSSFPNGWLRILNSGATGLKCGLFAMVDSLRHQLGLNPTINGVSYNLNGLPTTDDLNAIYRQLKARGDFDMYFTAEELNEDGNFNVDILGLILIEWGKTVNMELSLGYILAPRRPYITSSPYDNPKMIWIFNDNAQELLGNVATGQPVYNHWEGLKRRDGP